jgi:hypothetical protein
MSDYEEYEAMPNKAFSSMVLSFATSMKVSGATDDEIQEAMNNAVFGIINIIQDYNGFSKRVLELIRECSSGVLVNDERIVGMKCELLDQVEDAVANKVDEILGYDNVS